MNTKTIRIILVIILSIMCVPDLSAQGIIVYKSNGTTEKIPYAAIDSIVSYADYADKEESKESSQTSVVDLGLSVKWAACNLGASSPEEFGDYFAWGETEAKDSCSWANYKWCNGTSSTFTKYCWHESFGTVDGKTIFIPNLRKKLGIHIECRNMMQWSIHSSRY